MNRFLWPLVGFIVLVVLLGVGLTLNPRDVPSPLVGKPAPAFSLPRLQAPEEQFSPRDMLGKVWLLNVWASWCVSCRQEHPLLVELAKRHSAPLVGLNYKEVRGDAAIDIDKVAPGSEKGMVIERAGAWLSANMAIPTPCRCSTSTAASASTTASTACPKPTSSTRPASSA
jgi:cytochrome c biogenesis protein CcmG/thiol:disulfide interchange protein DsbE